ncbi:uncharacterized protein LOC141657252 [Silene latifolia]|uniref:uncharacterized protein LOC141657252 n=1 Tax=Silene latifolia TaxID=37657 RepID=UPI003D772124
MAPKKKLSPPSTNLSSIPIGNCEVSVQGKANSVKCESINNSLQISASTGTKIKISVMEKMNESRFHGLDSVKLGETEDGGSAHVDCQFLLINPNDPDSVTKPWLQEIMNLYMKELPGMNYAANTGKQSSFLQRCVSSGKFCTLLLSEKSVETSHKVIAAITYQIIPADTQHAEIPLAAVCSTYQQKGVGRLLYMELRNRLQDVGIGTILCWGDKESEGFWQKQGFVSIAEVGTKGRARRLPIKADIRRALCFPGGSTLMISYLNKNLHGVEPRLIKLRLESAEKTSSSDMFYSFAGIRDASALQIAERSPGQQNLQLELNAVLESNSMQKAHRIITLDSIDADIAGDVTVSVPVKQISPTNKGEAKRRIWETSSCSFNSKRVKATHTSDYQSHPDTVLALNNDQKHVSVSNQSLLGVEENIIMMKNKHVDALMACAESQAKRKNIQIMLMDIADGPKKAYLVKTIVDLGGSVASDGSVCTHVLTGKARRTLNFCTALCAGAWILSPHWLKESSREGRFVDEVPFILKDEEYLTKFRADLKDAVFRARENPRGLLDGYRICLTTQVHPPIKMLSAIIRSAGGTVNVGLGEVVEQSRTIFIANEEDMEEALVAVKSGIRTFSSDWFMNCIMKQELDLDAPQFVESL